MPKRKTYSPLDLDDDLSDVASELRVISAALDSRSTDIDRRQASDLIKSLTRQIRRIDELRTLVNPKRGGRARQKTKGE